MLLPFLKGRVVVHKRDYLGSVTFPDTGHRGPEERVESTDVRVVKFSAKEVSHYQLLVPGPLPVCSRCVFSLSAGTPETGPVLEGYPSL